MATKKPEKFKPKPCPFCGCKAIVRDLKSSNRKDAQLGFLIECEASRCLVNPKVYLYWSAALSDRPDDKIAAAQKAWNTRK